MVEQAIDWTEKAIRVLRKLLEVLNLTIKAWESFEAEDAHCFTNIPFPLGAEAQEQSFRSLRMIQERFRGLKSLRERLLSLTQSFEGFKGDVSKSHYVYWLILTI